MTDPRQPIFAAVRAARPDVFNDVPERIAILDGVLDDFGIPRAGEIVVEAARPRRKIAWGAKVSQTFRDRVWWIADQLHLDPDDLMACIAWESGRTFSASVRNMAGSGATGLIQFMPATARGLDTTTAELAAMRAEDQLNYVYKYFEPFAGRLATLSDVYMAILWPRAVGKPESYVLWDRAKMPTTYRQNSGLDANRNGKVTKAECAAKLRAIKAEGLRAENVG